MKHSFAQQHFDDWRNISCVHLQGNEVVTALIGLFKAFAERENSEARSQVVDPTQLRVALGNLQGDRFNVGGSPKLFQQVCCFILWSELLWSAANQLPCTRRVTQRSKIDWS